MPLCMLHKRLVLFNSASEVCIIKLNEATEAQDTILNFKAVMCIYSVCMHVKVL